MKKEGFIACEILARSEIDFQVFVSYSFCLKEFAVPENPEKKLGGFVVETHSSNAAIEKTLRGLEREILGVVGEPTDAVTAQTLPPVNIGKTSGGHNSVEQANLTRFPSEKLTHKDSAFANNIHHSRVLKKAA